ncbi:hypothetical protein ONZ45_g19275 [Pleurotus djamor]|nr:hypothetical protein ONZ45_g19275 [Pleurotus djamor]
MDKVCNPLVAKVIATTSLIKDNVLHIWAAAITDDAWHRMCNAMRDHFDQPDDFTAMCYAEGYFIGGNVIDAMATGIEPSKERPLDVYVDRKGSEPLGHFLQANGYVPVGQYEAVGRGTRMFYYRQGEGEQPSNESVRSLFGQCRTIYRDQKGHRIRIFVNEYAEFPAHA